MFAADYPRFRPLAYESIASGIEERGFRDVPPRGTYLKATFFSRDTVYLKMKIDDEEYLYDLTIYNDELYLPNYTSQGYTVLKNALTEGKTIKCVIKSVKYGDTYNFTIDGIGFKEKLEEAGLY